jgi:ribonuclease P protein component
MQIGRVHDRRSFLRLRAEGRRGRSGPVSVTAVLDPAVDPPRLAFAVGRRTGNAVVRNRVRRRLRAAASAAPPAPGLYMVQAGPAATDLAFGELASHLDAAFAAAAQRWSS